MSQNESTVTNRRSALSALLTGAGSTFGFFQDAELARYTVRESVEDRMYANFARVGQHLESAMRKVAHEQKTAQ